MDMKEVIAELDTRMKAVAAERDRLDEFIGETEHLRENCRSAWEDLQRARDALSELV